MPSFTKATAPVREPDWLAQAVADAREALAMQRAAEQHEPVREPQYQPPPMPVREPDRGLERD
jgi:hypothetical protein